MFLKLFNNTRKKYFNNRRKNTKRKAKGVPNKKDVNILHKAAKVRGKDINWPSQWSGRASKKVNFGKKQSVKKDPYLKTARISLTRVKKPKK